MIGGARARVSVVAAAAAGLTATAAALPSVAASADMYGLPHAGASASAAPITDVWN